MKRYLATLILLLFCATPSAAQFAIFQAHTPTVASYDGLFSTRAATNIAEAVDTTNKELMGRTTHIARSTVTSLKVMTSNFFRSTVGKGEPGSGATATISASVEYPSGTCTQILFSGSADGSIPDVDVLVSDYATVSIPNGATFWIRQFWRSTAGTIYTTTPQFAGDQLKLAVSGLANQTLSCDAITGGSTTALHLPIAIIAQTTSPTICVIGDSLVFGLGGNLTANGDRGLITQTTGPLFGYSNLAVYGEASNNFVSDSTQRQKVFPYCSHAIINFGLNDFVNSRTVAHLKSSLTTIYGMFAGSVTVFQTTLTPLAATSDGCSTQGGQTSGFVAQRTEFNDDLRDASFGPNGGYFEVADEVEEPPQNSGFWITSPQYSSDCTHLNTTGYAAVATSGAIDTSRITLPYLLKRDLNPAANDNTPMYVDQAA